MTIQRLLEDSKLDVQEQQLLELAYRRTLQRLNVVDRADPLCEAVARKIIDVHRCGATDAIAIFGVGRQRA
ncbi:hypothetical protein [Bradyrhizobium sp.]|uniref:hypothetical protein n=1 Tax=Bradyrhizobium sp. TaxID=376 RepID=UPI001DDA9EC8|nr:hypothetical protein [Bradyrhizobium sp.]MBV8701552.1 hypothetical protein [Bradyrhizobium sp.]MBV8921443.1 hypothetical protein [Bradyrhizobium sp.]MBV9984012.1 hypothetical protein [Bradyrhizobium sp.]